MSRLTRDGVPSHETKFFGANADREILTDHVQDWQPYLVNPYSCFMSNHTYILVVRMSVEGLSGGCRAGLTLKRCSQLAAFAIQPVG